jgi:hypothetical protein
MIDREYVLTSIDEETRGTIWKGALFSSFHSKKHYNGLIPTGEYFVNIILKLGKTIPSFHDNEVKKLLSHEQNAL